MYNICVDNDLVFMDSSNIRIIMFSVVVDIFIYFFSLAASVGIWQSNHHQVEGNGDEHSNLSSN